MNDIGLLGLAAKAAGFGDGPFDFSLATGWNPLEYDSDAFRLAVKLKINVMGSMASGNLRYATFDGDTFTAINSDPITATRRAIVLAAANLGKAMP